MGAKWSTVQVESESVDNHALALSKEDMSWLPPERKRVESMLNFP